MSKKKKSQNSRRKAPKEAFHYWKRPWIKWVILAGALLQFMALFVRVHDMNMVLSAEAEIFTPAQRDRYEMGMLFNCMTNAVTAVAFLGLFVLGGLFRNRRAAKLGETVIIWAVAASIALGLVFWHEAIRYVWIWIWLVIAAFGCGCYTLWQSKRPGIQGNKKKTHNVQKAGEEPRK